VFFDGNDSSEKGYTLNFDQSRLDLALIGDELREGLRVLIYSPGELEAEALLTLDADAGIWCADLAPGAKWHYLNGLPPWDCWSVPPFVSSFWRSGGGEIILDVFGEFFAALTQEERDQYELDNSEPPGWEGFYASLRAGIASSPGGEIG
jgi:hypothetical protein